MFRPYIKRTWILVLMAVVNLLLVYISYNSYKFDPNNNYDLKVKSSEIMKEALLHTSNLSSPFEYDSDDIFNSGLIGVDTLSSPMTTEKGLKHAKIITTNPDFSALFVHLFSKIDSSLVNPLIADTIAVSFTGSFPGANIALLSACKALNIHPVIISSMGSSEWGANRLDMTWLDIEDYLNKKIFDYKSVAVSLGGRNDTAEELEEATRDSMINKIVKYKYEFIQESDLQKAVDRRMEIYNSKHNNYKAYVTIGGSVASLGDSTTWQMFDPGLIKGKNKKVVEAIKDAEGEDLIDEHINRVVPVIQKFTEKVEFPVINIREINKLSEWNGINYKKEDFSNNIEVGKSKIFGKTTQYHPLVLWICLLTSFLMLVWVIFSSILQVNKKMKEIEYE